VSVTPQEIREALDDYVDQARANERVGRMLRTWQCAIHFEALDSNASFTLNIASGEIADPEEGLRGQADLIVSATGDELTSIFWGESNPAERYNRGAVQVRGPQEHLMRLDAVTMLVFLNS
jgi:SCP-2 sterol transfer family